MSWPLLIKGRTWTRADFEPYGYAQSLPVLLSDMAEEMADRVALADAAAASAQDRATAAADSAAAARHWADVATSLDPAMFVSGRISATAAVAISAGQAVAMTGTGLGPARFDPFAGKGAVLSTTALTGSAAVMASVTAGQQILLRQTEDGLIADLYSDISLLESLPLGLLSHPQITALADGRFVITALNEQGLPVAFVGMCGAGLTISEGPISLGSLVMADKIPLARLGDDSAVLLLEGSDGMELLRLNIGTGTASSIFADWLAPTGARLRALATGVVLISWDGTDGASTLQMLTDVDGVLIRQPVLTVPGLVNAMAAPLSGDKLMVAGTAPDQTIEAARLLWSGTELSVMPDRLNLGSGVAVSLVQQSAGSVLMGMIGSNHVLSVRLIGLGDDELVQLVSPLAVTDNASDLAMVPSSRGALILWTSPNGQLAMADVMPATARDNRGDFIGIAVSDALVGQTCSWAAPGNIVGVNGVAAGRRYGVGLDGHLVAGDAGILAGWGVGDGLLLVGAARVDARPDVSDFASAAQGNRADTAVQWSDLPALARTGAYADLADRPIRVGDIIWTCRVPGSGWLPCDGAVCLSAEWPVLASLLGSAGAPSFTVPTIAAQGIAVPYMRAEA